MAYHNCFLLLQKKSTGKKYMQNTANMSGASGQNFGEKEDFKLEEKVTAESEGIRLLCMSVKI